MERCPVCQRQANKQSAYGDYSEYECPRCGHYKISGTAKALLPDNLKLDEDYPALVSYSIRHRADVSGPIPLITSQWIEQTLKYESLPTPIQQVNNLILYIGDKLKNRLDRQIFPLDFNAIASKIGAFNEHAVTQLLQNMATKGWIPTSKTGIVVTLTFDGWEKYEQLRKGANNTKKAFMAMPFGFERLNDYFHEHYTPTVKKTGFELERVDTNPGAGSITNRMLLEIQRSKFLLADLTHNNNGAYWEAGYAEGLRKPVIYLCEKVKNANKRPHFDIRNHQTIFWTEETLPEAMENLKAAIRATFPDEAIMEDSTSAPLS